MSQSNKRIKKTHYLMNSQNTIVAYVNFQEHFIVYNMLVNQMTAEQTSFWSTGKILHEHFFINLLTYLFHFEITL